MIKKSFLVLVLTFLFFDNSFAQTDHRFSLGVGGYITGDFGGGIDTSWSLTHTTGEVITSEIISSETPYFGGGAFVFFDMVFVELSLGFFGANGTSRIMPMKEEIIIDLTKKEVDVSYGGLDIGFLGKFPFAASKELTVFPLLGINYRSILLFKNKTGNYKDYDPWVFSALWFKFGGGMDYSITDSIFLRGQVMYGVRLPNKIEKYLVSGSDEIGISFYDTPALFNIDTRRGHGPSVKFAVGFRL